MIKGYNMSQFYHIPSNTEYDDHGTFAKKLTHCGNPWLLDLTQYESIPVVYAELTESQKYGEPILEADRRYYPAVAKSAEALAGELASKLEQMDAACRSYIDKHAHWTAAPMIWDKAKGGKPKAADIKAWVEAVWGLYYQRLANLAAGGAWDDSYLDFSVVGPCPHRIVNALQE